jgi:hypothetical protein
MRPILTALALAVTALLAACGTSSSIPKLSPSASAAAHAAEQRGITILTRCSHGNVAVAAILSHQATTSQYVTAVRYLKDPANRATVWNCAAHQPGSANVPGTDMAQKMENCWTTSPAETQAIDHPFHAAHHAKNTAAALLNAAVVCIGKAA